MNWSSKSVKLIISLEKIFKMSKLCKKCLQKYRANSGNFHHPTLTTLFAHNRKFLPQKEPINHILNYMIYNVLNIMYYIREINKMSSFVAIVIKSLKFCIKLEIIKIVKCTRKILKMCMNRIMLCNWNEVSINKIWRKN